MTATIEKNELVLRLPINRRPSKTGKNIVIASTNGNVPSTLQVEGKTVTVGVNAYFKA